MRVIEYTNSFKRDFRRVFKGERGAALKKEFKAILDALVMDEALPVKNRDHALTGNWKGYRDCHVRPDLLLIYQRLEHPARLVLVRLGSHAQLNF